MQLSFHQEIFFLCCGGTVVLEVTGDMQLSKIELIQMHIIVITHEKRGNLVPAD